MGFWATLLAVVAVIGVVVWAVERRRGPSDGKPLDFNQTKRADKVYGEDGLG